MKKVDLIVIILILFSSVLFYSIYFTNNKINDGDAFITITYKNQTIYNHQFDDSLNEIIEINSVNSTLQLNDNGKISYFNINSSKDIYNQITISDGEVRITDANCDNKYIHIDQKLTLKSLSPIVCINGITIKVSSKNSQYEILV